MSNRHRTRQAGATSALQEDRENRKAEHRRVRRTVNQALHMASLNDDHDGLVLELPHATHGYTEVYDEPGSREAPKPRKRLRHWKQSFWKRRNNERRRRNMAYDALA
ncbi:MAG: hypothetical protein GY812_12395 [Actinomycetia bacterium]|nr:hypothetical protein [Actinomycetes bacterium]